MANNTQSIMVRSSAQSISQNDVKQLLEVIVAESRAEIVAALEHARRPNQVPAPTEAKTKAVVKAVDQLPAPMRKALLDGAASLAGGSVAMPRRVTAAAALGLPAAGPAAPTAHSQLRVRLRKIECVQDTNELGKDEIFIGGTGTVLSITPDGTLSEPIDNGTVDPIALGKFRAGDKQNLSLECGRFALNGATPYPRIFSMTLVMLEKDFGNADALVTVMKAIQAVIEKKVVEKLSEFVKGLEVDATIQTLLALAVTVLPIAISRLIAAVGKLFGDEVFKPFAAAVTLAGPDALFPGGKSDSADDVAQFADFGGSYKVTYDFALT